MSRSLRLSSLLLVLSGALLAGVPARAQKICIDPGHGGGDPGGVGCGLEEEDVVLDVSQRLRTLLQQSGFTVVITRNSDAAVSLSGRSDFANAQAADRFASIHSNAFADASANGTETFCHTSQSANSVDMRNRIQTEMIQAWGLTNRGNKTADFAVLRETNMPATLSELGFITNCSVDAVLLGDADERQSAAQAHLEAVAGHLGVDVDDPPPPADGTLNGVVFEDQGVGTENMDTRLAGATVLVVDTGETLTASADGAAFTFTLAPGAHTVRASLAGYTTAERSCTVVAGDIAWCSIGLFPVAGGEEGEGEGGEEGEGDVGEEGEGEGGEEGEGDIGDDTGDPGEPDPNLQVERVSILPPVKPVGGCASTSTSSAAIAILALALLGVRRRRHACAAAVVLLTSTAVHAAPDVSNARVVARGMWTAALLSPDGGRALVAEDRYAGLSIVTFGADAAQARVRMLTEATRAGFRAVWVDDTHVAYRNPARPFDGDPLVTLDLDGRFTGPFVEKAAVRQRSSIVDGSDVDVVERRVGAAWVQISPASDRCFGPISSSRGDVVFQCLVTGLYLSRANAPAMALGQGTSPSFSADGRFAVFAVTGDEGHVVTSSDIVVVDLRAPAAKVRALPKTSAIERSPSLSKDGSAIAWLDEDKLVVARLSLGGK